MSAPIPPPSGPARLRPRRLWLGGAAGVVVIVVAALVVVLVRQPDDPAVGGPEAVAAEDWPWLRQVEDAASDGRPARAWDLPLGEGDWVESVESLGERVGVALSDGERPEFVVVDADGEEVWRHVADQTASPSGTYQVSPDRERVYVYSGTILEVLDADDGEQLWAFTGDIAEVQEVGDVVLVGHSDIDDQDAEDTLRTEEDYRTAKVSVLDIGTGHEHGVVDGDLVAVGPAGFATLHDDRLTMRDLSGEERWHLAEELDPPFPFGTNVAICGVGAVLEWEDEAIGLDLTTGEELWRVDLPEFRWGRSVFCGPGGAVAVLAKPRDEAGTLTLRDRDTVTLSARYPDDAHDFALPEFGYDGRQVAGYVRVRGRGTYYVESPGLVLDDRLRTVADHHGAIVTGATTDGVILVRRRAVELVPWESTNPRWRLRLPRAWAAVWTVDGAILVEEPGSISLYR